LYTGLHLEKIFAKDKGVEITLVNQDNFFLFTHMPTEGPSSSIEARHVICPIMYAGENKDDIHELRRYLTTVTVDKDDAIRTILRKRECPRLCRRVKGRRISGSRSRWGFLEIVAL
jgi:hypothetical protein